MRDPNYPKAGLIFTSRWQWAFVVKGPCSHFKDEEDTSNNRISMQVKPFRNVGFRIVRSL